MKTQNIARISIGVITVISALTVMVHPIMAIDSFCDQHFDHGPTLSETIGKEHCENPMTQINYHGVNLTVTNMINKTTFQVGENITVVPELTNAGNRNVTIGYCGQLFVTLTMDESDKIVSPQYSWACPLFGKGVTLPSNSSTTGEGYGQIIALHTPGNYTIRSIASFGGESNSIVLWSEPIQITIIQEKYVHNETNSINQTSSNATGISNQIGKNIVLEVPSDITKSKYTLDPQKEKLAREKQQILVDTLISEEERYGGFQNRTQNFPWSGISYDYVDNALEVHILPEYFNADAFPKYFEKIRSIVGNDIDVAISPLPYAEHPEGYSSILVILIIITIVIVASIIVFLFVRKKK